MTEIRVLVIDEITEMRLALAALLNLETDMTITEADSAHSGLHMAAKTCPDIIIIADTLDSLALTTELHRECPTIRIIALADRDDAGTCKLLRDAGASVCVPATVMDPQRLVDAIRRVHAEPSARSA